MLAALALLAVLAAGAFDEIGHDARLYATAPSRWGTPEWGLAAATAGATGLLLLADRPIRDDLRTRQDSTLSTAARAVRQAGEGRWTVPALGVAWAIGSAAGNSRAARTGREGLEAFAFSGFFSQALKYGAGRLRPDHGEPLDWNASRRNEDGLSFPSGHAQAAFSVLTVAALEYREVPGIAPLALGLAGACALSRVYDARHWTSDVFLGSVLGFASAWAVVQWNRHPADPASSSAPTARIIVPF